MIKEGYQEVSRMEIKIERLTDWKMPYGNGAIISTSLKY